MHKIYLIFFFILLVSDCGSTIFKNTESVSAPVVREQAPEPVNAPTIIKLEHDSFAAQIEYDPQGKFISEWKNDGQGIVINGAYFDTDYTPSGLLIINKNRIGKRMFDQNKTGLIAVTNNLTSIRDLAVSPVKNNESLDFALQSYPFLIKNSQAALATDSGKKARRTALGIDAENNLYIISVTSYQPTLYEFMNQIIATKIPFTFVLNLDGGPSSGIYANWGKTQLQIDSFTKVSSVVRFKAKQ